MFFLLCRVALPSSLAACLLCLPHTVITLIVGYVFLLSDRLARGSITEHGSALGWHTSIYTLSCCKRGDHGNINHRLPILAQRTLLLSQTLASENVNIIPRLKSVSRYTDALYGESIGILRPRIVSLLFIRLILKENPVCMCVYI